MTKPLTNTEKLLDLISHKFMAGELDNTSLVQIIELAGDYLNLVTISEYAKQNKMSYNGVKKCRDIVTLFGCKFVQDNY